MTPFLRTVLALIIGAAGGFVFYALTLPLPWMLGALFAGMAASVGGLPVLPPMRIRPAVVAVIGVMLGARFTPAVMDHAAAWSGSLALLLVYICVVAAVVVPFYRLCGKFDWVTAYFAGMPGGLNEMIEIGEAKGADVRSIILAHSLRIVVTIALIAVWFRVIQGHAVSSSRNWVALDAVSLPDAALMIGCAVLGAFGGGWLRLPAASFLGPMILSGALHLSGLSDGAPPTLVVNAAQVLLGTVLGCRFLGVRLVELARAAVLSLGSTVLTLAIALVFCLILQRFLGIGFEQAMLALAPGGLTEMGLVALAIHADVAFVALHHVVRILVVILLAPALFSLVARWGRR